MGYGDWGLLMLFVYLRPPLYPMPWKHLQSSGLPQIWHIHMKSIYLYIYICIYWMLCFSNIYIYNVYSSIYHISMYIEMLYTYNMDACVCVMFFCVPCGSPHLIFFCRGFPVGQLTWKSWHGKVWNPVSLHAKTTQKKNRCFSYMNLELEEMIGKIVV